MVGDRPGHGSGFVLEDEGMSVDVCPQWRFKNCVEFFPRFFLVIGCRDGSKELAYGSLARGGGVGAEANIVEGRPEGKGLRLGSLFSSVGAVGNMI